MLGSAGQAALDGILRHIGEVCGRDANQRRVSCRREEAGTEHAALRRLLPSLGEGPPGPEEMRRSALARVEGLLEQGPLLLTVTEAQWCDEGTLRCVDHLVRRTDGRPLTVLLNVPAGGLAAAGASFHELASRDYCTVTDVADPWLSGLGRPPGEDLDELARRDPGLLRVAQAAAMLRSGDADLVGALAGLPAGPAGRALRSSRVLGLLPETMPAGGSSAQLDRLLDALPAERGALMRVQAAEILNDAARPAVQVADLLLGQPAPVRPWMATILKEAAVAARRDRPASVVSYLTPLHETDPQDATVRTDLATALLDIDPATALRHLDGSPSRGTDPRIRARATASLRLASLMTHRTPATPDALGGVLRELEAAHPDDVPYDRTRPAPVGSAALSSGASGGYLALTVRAVRSALTGAGSDSQPATVVTDTMGDARQVLAAEPPRPAWERVAAARVLGLADDTAAALDHLDRAVADSRGRDEPWAEGHARSARAQMLLESGRAYEAAQEALAASRTAGAQGARPAPITLALALLSRCEVDRAEAVLRRLDGRDFEDAVWEHHHHLVAQALLARGRGHTERALELMERCGAGLTAAGIGNPVFTAWWMGSTELLMELGLTGAAHERAALGRQLADRWPTARSTGLSLLAEAAVAEPPERVDLLTECVRLLGASSDRFSHARAELQLGRAYLQRDDDKAARGHLRAAQAMAMRGGLTAVARQARDALAAAGGRPARVVLTSAERPVAELAAAGATNRAIADALYLTVRTVEYHLTNVYRKLGVTGRSGLAAYFPGRGPHPPARPLDEGN
ncbi:LuxR C-terminal-related transcriptional regulator [Streptomyces sp. NPDC049970]|uniref:helix-turn-helix transcriptional regulator n=1 Tax=Streptomyces sp. NPDC049970 TaxID=3155033 RepID=UPI003443B687